jgi:hypothetical protein
MWSPMRVLTATALLGPSPLASLAELRQAHQQGRLGGDMVARKQGGNDHKGSRDPIEPAQLAKNRAGVWMPRPDETFARFQLGLDLRP